MFDINNFLRAIIFPAQLVVLLLVATTASAEAPSPIDLTEAAAAFAEARAVTDKDGGHLWGMALYGPMFFVDPATRAVVANVPDLQGVLHKDGDLYVGILPDSVIVSDSPAEWGGKRWTMLRWPLTDDTNSRRVAFAHELFHRIQPALHLDAPDMPNLQLDTLEGRISIQLEWRALAVALATSGPAQTQAIRDALAFRAHRHALFPGADVTERSLEIAEGVPEFTGVAVASPDVYAARWRTIAKLSDPDPSKTFVRFFAYISGPAYGLLLDERVPGWRKKLTATSDLGLLLASTAHGPVPDDTAKRAEVYGESTIRIAETDRAVKADEEKARYRALLVDGPTLLVPRVDNFRFSFRPSAIISLGSAGAVNPIFHVTDSWGTLDVTGGALVPTDFNSATVAAPSDIKGPHVQGPGWTLDLAPGWQIVPATKPGSYTVRKE